VEKEIEPIEWNSHPVREERKKAVFSILFLLILWISVYISFGIFWFLLSILLIGGSLFPFFTVTRYRLDQEGVTVRKPFYTVKKGWRQFRSYYPERNGVLLSPFLKPSRLENFRGLFLLFPRQGMERERIIHIVGRWIPKEMGTEKES